MVSVANLNPWLGPYPNVITFIQRTLTSAENGLIGPHVVRTSTSTKKTESTQKNVHTFLRRCASAECVNIEPSY